MKIIVDIIAKIKNGQLVSIENDIDFSKIIVDNHCQYNIINEMGPGGGWPEIEISGNRQNLEKILDIIGYDELDEILGINQIDD